MNRTITLASVMSKRVVTVTAGKTVRDAARLMNRHEIGSLVVKDGAKIAGILTERDILQVVAKGKDPDTLRVAQIMSRPVIVGQEQNDLPSAIKLMVLHRIKKLPVMRGKRLVGIVTLTDFARVGPVVQDMMMRAMEETETKHRRSVERKFRKYVADKEPPQGFYA